LPHREHGPGCRRIPGASAASKTRFRCPASPSAAARHAQQNISPQNISPQFGDALRIVGDDGQLQAAAGVVIAAADRWWRRLARTDPGAPRKAREGEGGSEAVEARQVSGGNFKRSFRGEIQTIVDSAGRSPRRLAGPGAYSFFRARTALAASAAESRAT
jgi:hypothetical protein